MADPKDTNDNSDEKPIEIHQESDGATDSPMIGAVHGDVTIVYGGKTEAPAPDRSGAVDTKPESTPRPVSHAGDHIFISYARVDGLELAGKLYHDLAAAGHPVWQDEPSLNPYRSFDYEIEQAIKNAIVMLALITPDVVAREDSFVRQEIAYAKANGVDIIPVVLCPAGDVPVNVQLLTWIAFEDYDQCLRDLLARLDNPPDSAASPAVALSARDRELAYLKGVIDRFEIWQYGYTDLSGQVQRERRPQVAVRQHMQKFVNMENSVYRDLGFVEEGATQPADTVNELRGVVKANRVVLIGDPGSGKTTTLQRLAYEFAAAAVQDEDAALPVFVPLGAYNGGGLDRHIAAYFDGLRMSDYLPGRLVVLLDGLNEMPKQYVSEVDRWLGAHPDTLTAVTCRKLDYAALQKLPLRRVDVAPLDVFRIQMFIGNYLEDADRDRLFWALAGEDMTALWGLWQQAELDFESFWGAEQELDSNHPVYKQSNDRLDAVYNDMRTVMKESGELPGLLGLVSNPFLLDITIKVFIASGQPPRNRGQLFSAFVKMLIEKRGYPARSDEHPWIEARTQQAALAKLAYRMQWERRGTSVRPEWAVQALREVCPGEDAANLLYLAESSTLLVTDTAGEVKFFHQLLQEYFAAYEMGEDMRRGVPAGNYWPDGKWWEPTGWEETVVLLAGMNPAEQGGAGRVVDWLQDTHPVLACRALSEGGAAGDSERMTTVQQVLVTAMTGAALPVARVEAGSVINRLGDPRPGVGLPQGGPDVDRDYWVAIPGGLFLMGSDKEQDSQARDNELPQQTFDLDTFYMARYPVTNGQFAAFVTAPEGYNERQWWTEAGWEWKGERVAPDEYGDPAFREPNQPRIYVRWYEAYAFCNWLGERLGCLVRLPTEAEWEKAARGTEGLVYPWGDEWDATKLNSSESSIGRPSAVGLYPQGASPYGVLDMAGNVWEWCLTAAPDGEYWNYAEGIETMDNAAESTRPRVLRGGSFFNDSRYCRAAYRLRSITDGWNDVIGFRVVVGPSYDGNPVGLHGSVL